MPSGAREVIDDFYEKQRLKKLEKDNEEEAERRRDNGNCDGESKSVQEDGQHL